MSLIEGMVSILIFSFGVLAIVALQARLVTHASDARYRSEAAMAANDLVAQMLAGNRNPTALAIDYADDGAAFLAWEAGLQTKLPGVVTNPPMVVVTPAVIPGRRSASIVQVTVRWKDPTAAIADPPRQYVTRTEIVACSAGANGGCS